jgi:hypothetical protein
LESAETMEAVPRVATTMTKAVMLTSKIFFILKISFKIFVRGISLTGMMISARFVETVKFM